MEQNELNKMYEEIESFLKIASDNTRLRILYSLVEKEMCVCELQEELDASQSLISHQLRVLRDGGFVNQRKHGKHRYYSLSDDHVKQLLDVVYEHVIEEKKERTK